MNHKNIIKVFAAMLLTAPLVFTASCSTDEYAKLNTNPATINKSRFPISRLTICFGIMMPIIRLTSPKPIRRQAVSATCLIK